TESSFHQDDAIDLSIYTAEDLDGRWQSEIENWYKENGKKKLKIRVSILENSIERSISILISEIEKTCSMFVLKTFGNREIITLCDKDGECKKIVNEKIFNLYQLFKNLIIVDLNPLLTE